MAGRITHEAIDKLYEQCGINIELQTKDQKINNKVLNNALNADFSNIYGKGSVNNLSSFTIIDNID